jgi:hypothetical protein
MKYIVIMRGELKIQPVVNDNWMHRRFDTFWEAWGHKLQIEQGLLSHSTRFTDEWIAKGQR